MKKKVILLLVIISFTSCDYKYKIRKNGVYYLTWNEGNGRVERLVKNADPKTFKKIDRGYYSYYGKDVKNVFYKGLIIPGADAKTFRLLNKIYAVDYKRAYCDGDSITNSNSEGFEVIEGYYSKDLIDVYYATKPLNVTSLEKFEFVFKDGSDDSWNRWTTDGYYYYIKNYKVPSNDYENIILYKKDAEISSDKNYVYHLNRNIYFNKKGERIIDTIDMKTFKVLGTFHYRDKSGCINPFGRIYHGRTPCK